MKTKDPENAKKQILIVDDISDNLDLLSSLLTDRGYEVKKVRDGEIALNLVRSAPPDLILLDVMLPVIDGYQICQSLKNDLKTQEIPIIFLSALDEVLDKVKAFKVGGNDYITKPFFAEEVLVRIENQLTIKKQKELLQKEIYQKEKTQKELYRSRELLNGLLNSSLDGVAAFESVRDNNSKIIDFRWLLANPVAAMIAGTTKTHLLGKTLKSEHFKSLFFDRLFEDFIEVVNNCIVLEKEYYYERESFQAWFQIVAVKLGDGFAVTFRDLTERKQIELALKATNQELYRQVNLDSLTQIANRRRFNEYLYQEWGRCSREKQPMSLILGDVDYFKLYNDTYGHQSGDDCLVHIAQTMSALVKRSSDLAVRYGGEEFAVILPNTNSQGAMQIAETIRNKIKDLKIPHVLSEVSPYVTMSLGVAAIIPHQKLSPEYLIASADAALYEAKEQGRDRVIVKISERALI
jgi:diguanylate cyclase (GGDEF)-like protein